MARSRDIAVKMIYEAFKILKETDNELPGKEVIEKVGERLEFDDWGLTKEERKDVYRGVCRLVWDRLSKAGSV
jgi:hypothetical protein